MAEDGVDVDAAVAAAQRVADLHVDSRCRRRARRGEHLRAAGDALDGDLGARAAVGGGVDGDGVGELGRALRGVLPVAAVAAHHLDAVVDEGGHGAAVLADGGLDDAVVEGQGAAVVGDSNGGVGIVAESSRRNLGREHKRRGRNQRDETNRKSAGGRMIRSVFISSPRG